MAGRPPRPRQDRFEAMTMSIMERITFRSGRDGKAPKVAPSSKVYIGATRFDGTNKSQRSGKSHRSSKTGGRQHDDDLDDSSDLALAFDSGDKADARAAKASIAQPKLSTRRISTRSLRFTSIDREQSKKASAAAAAVAAAAVATEKPGTEDILSNFVYEDGENGLNESDSGGSDSNYDDEDGRSQSFIRRAMSDAEDEMDYFTNRSGQSDFKVRRRYTLHPHGRFRACWDIFQLLLMTWVLVTVPFELCFSEISVVARRDILQSDLFVDAMFSIDILLNFNTAVERDGKLHFSLASILRYYSRNYFVQDLVWTFPFYALVENKDPFIYSAHGSASSCLFQFAVAHPWLYPFSRCLRLLRVVGIPRIQRRLEYSLLISSKVSSLGSFLFVVLALSHVFSCVFSYLAFSDEGQLALAIDSRVLQDSRLGTKYMAAFYWSIMTMTTVGYGDITVKTNLGRLFSLCAMAVGAGVFAYGITNVVSLFQQLYIWETEDRQKMDQVNIFMQHRGFPRKLRDEVRANIFNWRKVNRENKEHDREIFTQMARPIRAKVADLFCEQTMPDRMPFLAGCDSEFVHDLYLAMQVKLYLPGEDIIRQGEYGSEMYFLFVGHAQALVGLTPVATLGPNTCFGEFSIVNPRKARLATIQALDFCETHCVDRQTILSTFVCHPNVMRSVHQLVMLRSRKALTLLYENGGKSRTLLQGLALMWRTEGIQGVLPIGTSIDVLPVLQEFLPPPSSAVAPGTLPTGRRPSVSGSGSLAWRFSAARTPLILDPQTAAAAAGLLTSQRHRSPSKAENDHSPHGNAGHARPASHRASVCSSDLACINASLASARASLGAGGGAGVDLANGRGLSPLMTQTGSSEVHEKVIRRIGSVDPAAFPSPKRLTKRRSNPADHTISAPANSPPTSLPPTTTEEPGPREYGAILTQLQELARQQSALDERMAEILSLISPAEDRFNEQHRLNMTLPPLVRDRSQYFDLRSNNKGSVEDWYR